MITNVAVAVRPLKGKRKAEEYDLPPVNRTLISEYVRYQVFKMKSYRKATKTRSELSYSGRKLRAQKRTGKAAIGDRSSPSIKHGAKIHGPKHRRPILKMNKKARRKSYFNHLFSS